MPRDGDVARRMLLGEREERLLQTAAGAFDSDIHASSLSVILRLAALFQHLLVFRHSSDSLKLRVNRDKTLWKDTHMATDPKPLTGNSTIGEWLAHPEGGAAVRGLLAASGADEASLAPVLGLPLQQLVALSQGQMPQSVIDELVKSVNGGVIPETEAAGWQEKVSTGRFAGKTVVVTGAASGIGRATATRIAREGGRVVAVDISADKLAEFAASVDRPGAEIVTVAGDITQQESVDAIIAAAGDRIDGLANVAGINDDFSPLHETSDAMWDRVIGVNLTGTFKLTRAVLPAMMAAGSGSVVNVASEAGLRGNASGNAYTTSKHAVIGLTRSAAFMYGPQGIRVNAVAPGGVATGIPFPPHVSEAGSARLQPFQIGDPVAGDRRAARGVDHLLAQRRRREHQRRRASVRRRLVGAVAASRWSRSER